MTGKRVVLADDLTPLLHAVAKLLEGSFEVVGMVSDGQPALDAVLALAPDLAVLDISMPGMSGIEVARELKGRGTAPRSCFSRYMRTRTFWPLALPREGWAT